jgi:preprotein translocase subunit YajC
MWWSKKKKIIWIVSVIIILAVFSFAIYKLNKKRAVSMVGQFPSFTHASPVIIEYLEQNKN